MLGDVGRIASVGTGPAAGPASAKPSARKAAAAASGVLAANAGWPPPCGDAPDGRSTLAAAAWACGALAVRLAGAGWGEGDKLAQRWGLAGLGVLSLVSWIL